MRYVAVIVLALVGLGASCNPQPTPTPTPSPTPPECPCVVPPSSDSGWHNTSAEEPQQERWNEDLFVEGRDVIGDVCGRDPVESLDRMAAFFQSKNACAVRWTSDSLLVGRPDGNWEEWHAVSFASGCWATVPAAYKGLWYNSKARWCGEVK